MKTILIGLGNPILGDDGVGWKVVAGVEQAGLPPRVDSDNLALGGLALMERLIGYQRAVIVDAIQDGKTPPGSVIHFQLDQLSDHSSGHTTSSHDTSLQTALQMGRELGAQLPDHIDIVGISAKSVYDFSERLSPPVAAAVPQAVQLVLSILSQEEKS